MVDGFKSKLSFPRRARLSGRKAFEHVHRARTRHEAGPLLVYGAPNGQSISRIGFAVKRKVGHAVKRNRIKRRIREAFRLHRHEWPIGYDWMVVVRPHDAVDVEGYTELLSRAVQSLHKTWTSRS